jgi:ribosomal protein S18 acetylase RimI-like enzyme
MAREFAILGVMNLPASWTPEVVAEPQRVGALEMIWSALEPGLRRSLLDAAVADSRKFGSDFWSALVACQQDGAVAGVAWVQPHAGRAASIHGPVVRSDDPCLAASLARFSVEQAKRLDLTCIQALLPIEYTPQAAALTAAGFHGVANLLYMFSAAGDWPTRAPESALHFRPATQAELAKVIEQTYLGSLDCPAVDGLRNLDDVLAGYRATGNYLPENWLIVTVGVGAETRIVGCLLLADHPSTDQVELVYMGILPEARGHAWGSHLVRQAQWLVRQSGRQRLVLAVDEANQPAVRMYAASGLVTFDRKVLWLRDLSGSR